MPILGDWVKYSGLLIFIAEKLSEDIWHLRSALLWYTSYMQQVANSMTFKLQKKKKKKAAEGTYSHTLAQDDSESHDAEDLTQQSWQLPLPRHKLSGNMQPWHEQQNEASTSPGVFYGEEIEERRCYGSWRYQGPTPGEQRAVKTADKHDYRYWSLISDFFYTEFSRTEVVSFWRHW